MTVALIVFALVCVLFWRFINFALAGAIYLIRGGRATMHSCEDTARGILGGVIAILIILALLF